MLPNVQNVPTFRHNAAFLIQVNDRPAVFLRGENYPARHWRNGLLSRY